MYENVTSPETRTNAMIGAGAAAAVSLIPAAVYQKIYRKHAGRLDPTMAKTHAARGARNVALGAAAGILGGAAAGPAGAAVASFAVSGLTNESMDSAARDAMIGGTYAARTEQQMHSAPQTRTELT